MDYASFGVYIDAIKTTMNTTTTTATMTPEAQRIAIAEACGWYAMLENGEAWLWKDQKRFHVCAWQWDRVPTIADFKITPFLPDYINDLNAMHEAERVLTEAQKVEYARHIFCAEQQAHEESDETWHRCVFAAAAQRAEAFLRTIGKWKD